MTPNERGVMMGKKDFKNQADTIIRENSLRLPMSLSQNPDITKLDPTPEEPSVLTSFRPQLKQLVQMSSPVSKTFVNMTDIFKDIKIDLPDDKLIVCKVICAERLGLGDMMHMIRLCKVLDPYFAGRVRYFAETGDAPVFDNMVKEHRVNIEIIKPGEKITLAPDKVVLTLGISISSSLGDAGRSYQLMEIQSPTESPILNIRNRNHSDHFGLLPEAQGFWVDDIPLVENKGEALYKASATLKDFLGATQCQNADDASKWLENTWITQSYYYSQSCFYMTLLAQLRYLNKTLPQISRFIVKFNGKDREGYAWKNKIDSKIIEAMSQANVRTIRINQECILINDRNSLDLQLSNDRILPEDYSVFTTLLNAAFPGGDNTYSEAFSNPNLSLPPFSELRDYKDEWLDSFFRDFPKLRYIHHRCIAMNRTTFNKTEDILQHATVLSNAWLELAELENPSHVWREAFQQVKKHDIAPRIPAIVREQIFFALYPDGPEEKARLILKEKKNDCNPIEEYRSYVKETLAPTQSTIFSKSFHTGF